MSLMVSDNSLYLKNPKNGEFLPVSIFNSGADKSMEKIAEFAENVKSEASTAMEARKTELVESMQGDADGIKAQIVANAEVDLETKKNQVLEQIPADYSELTESVNQVKDDIANIEKATESVVHKEVISTETIETNIFPETGWEFGEKQHTQKIYSFLVVYQIQMYHIHKCLTFYQTLDISFLFKTHHIPVEA